MTTESAPTPPPERRKVDREIHLLLSDLTLAVNTVKKAVFGNGEIKDSIVFIVENLKETIANLKEASRIEADVFKKIEKQVTRNSERIRSLEKRAETKSPPLGELAKTYTYKQAAVYCILSAKLFIGVVIGLVFLWLAIHSETVQDVIVRIIGGAT